MSAFLHKVSGMFTAAPTERANNTSMDVEPTSAAAARPAARTGRQPVPADVSSRKAPVAAATPRPAPLSTAAIGISARLAAAVAAGAVLDSTERTTIRGGATRVCVVRGSDLPALWAIVRPWKENRPVSEDRVKWLALAERRAFEATGRYEFSSPPTTLCWMAAEGPARLYLIDGQHRHAAWLLLGSPADTEWLVHVVACADAAAVAKQFEWCNSGTPVPATYYAARVKQAVDVLLDLLAMEYPDTTSESKAPIRPRFNRATVHDELGAIPSLRDGVMFGQLTGEALFSAAKELNDARAELYEATPSAEKSVKCLAAAQKLGWHLGLSRDWPLMVVGAATSALLAVEDD